MVSDDGLFSEGVLRLLAGEAGLTTVEPSLADVILLDSRLEDALARCSTLRQQDGPRVILAAALPEEDWALDALGCGARGILVKSARSEELLKAVRLVHEGQIWAPRRLIEAWADRLSRAAAPRRAAGSVLEQQLSVRERDVFRHAAAGLGNKEMARRLAISEATVKVHLTRIFQKLGLRGRGQLAAAYHGLLAPAAGARGRALVVAHRGEPTLSPTVVRLKA